MENKTQTAGKTATESIRVTEMQKEKERNIICNVGCNLVGYREKRTIYPDSSKDYFCADVAMEDEGYVIISDCVSVFNEDDELDHEGGSVYEKDGKFWVFVSMSNYNTTIEEIDIMEVIPA